jgi:hypothetical protein
MVETKEDPKLERGVYVDDVAFTGYVGYKVIGHDGTLLLRSCIDSRYVDDKTEGMLWRWLAIYDGDGIPVEETHRLRIA